MTEIDDGTTAYVLETRRAFEDLRQVTAQLAGLLVLAGAGANSAAPDHPLLDSGEQLFRNAVDSIRGARVTAPARRHHQLVLRAARSVRRALDAARAQLGRQGVQVDIDPILAPLRAGYADLQRAADALPGFEIIAFDRGCCARSDSRPSRSADTGMVR
jgi:hypothetical protein